MKESVLIIKNTAKAKDSYIIDWEDGKANGLVRELSKEWIRGLKFGNGDTDNGLYENGKPSGYGEYY